MPIYDKPIPTNNPINPKYHFLPKKIELYLIKPFNNKKATAGNGIMITFKANSKREVDDFYRIGINLGAKDEGAPGPRHGQDYYAYIRDLDGNKICAFKKI